MGMRIQFWHLCTTSYHASFLSLLSSLHLLIPSPLKKTPYMGGAPIYTEEEKVVKKTKARNVCESKATLF